MKIGDGSWGVFLFDERRHKEHTPSIHDVIKAQCADGAGLLHGGALQSSRAHLKASIWYECHVPP